MAKISSNAELTAYEIFSLLGRTKGPLKYEEKRGGEIKLEI